VRDVPEGDCLPGVVELPVSLGFPAEVYYSVVEPGQGSVSPALPEQAGLFLEAEAAREIVEAPDWKGFGVASEAESGAAQKAGPAADREHAAGSIEPAEGEAARAQLVLQISAEVAVPGIAEQLVHLL
jgi:hypothetical protein